MSEWIMFYPMKLSPIKFHNISLELGDEILALKYVLMNFFFSGASCQN